MNSTNVYLHMVNTKNRYWLWTTEMVGQDLVDWFFKNYSNMNVPTFDPTSLEGNVSMLINKEFYSSERDNVDKIYMAIGDHEDTCLQVGSHTAYYVSDLVAREENDED